MSHNFPVHTSESAPVEARPLLQQAEKNLGMVPNLERVMASAPALLCGYVELWELFDQTSLSAIERQIVYQTANVENECNYCVPWHTKLSQLAKMPADTVQALRDGRELKDPKHEALRRFTQSLIRTRGKLTRAELEAFFLQGWTSQQALEVILGLAIKTMSNYTNSIAGTPLDDAVADLAWSKPVISMNKQ
ncbi:MAG TPA: carboxymuconolactone decarboxylase family protein [Cellvibrionaceae bacterium]